MMDRRWLPLNALRAFEAVGRHLSFTAAANALSVSQSAISRHVISLEALLGVQLFERRPQGLALTEAGASLLPVVHKSFDRLVQALNDIVSDGGGKVRTLRVQMPPTFAHQLAVPILRDFRQACPDIIVDIESPHGVSASARDADLSLVYAKPQVNDYVADLLWMVRLTPLCHPDLAHRFKGAELAQFLTENELLHVKLENEPRYVLWDMFVRQSGVGSSGVGSIDVERGLVFDTAILAAQYALSGEGVALLDAHMFAAEIAAGRLVAPYERSLEDGYGYYLQIHPEDLGDPAIALFRSWMIQRFAGAKPAPAAAGKAATRPRLRSVEPG
ncbi:transcriptional regulator GcvA [Aliidongia dinghuensis]|uniref:Transcriptional regulator GcvA n=1 Tax=Aliidongia dinghuensis TaxID=1867774 RepID=A0A8J3E300_9PROT|nr:LysR family transcriptional regulator [Aliidongia dinghuensis]GGF12410.1 transcriptional regulator GcvA [Aliidongia dinghuensis]